MRVLRPFQLLTDFRVKRGRNTEEREESEMARRQGWRDHKMLAETTTSTCWKCTHPVPCHIL